jgi:hypothetical protein
MSIPDKLRSRKFWAALLGAVLPIAASYLTGDVGLDKALELSSAVVISYVFGQGAVDALAARNAGPTIDAPEAPEG